MTLHFPHMLWLAVLLPLLIALYIWILLRRRHSAMRFGGLADARKAQGDAFLWRRHLPPAIMLVALAFLVLAGARPSAVLVLPMSTQTILLVMDVSVSMSADDVSPNRLNASQEAAKKFVIDLPNDVRIGVIAYGATAHLVQRPTLNRDEILEAIDSLHLQRSTGIGNAILLALDTIFPGDDIALNPWGAASREDQLAPSEPASRKSSATRKAAPGTFRDAAIVLLTDGQNTSGPSPLDAAQLAADRGVKVFTVGFGTKDGVIVGYQGMRMRVSLDEKTLKSVAAMTLGNYYHAGSSAELDKVYESLRSRVVPERQRTELTFLLAGLSLVLVALASALSMWWSGRVA